MAESWWGVSLALLTRLFAPLVAGVVTGLALRFAFGWPSTLAVIGGLVIVDRLEKVRRRQVGQALEPHLVGRAYGWCLAGYFAGLFTLAIVRAGLLAWGWLPGFAFIVALLPAVVVAVIVAAPGSEPGPDRFVRGRRLIATGQARRAIRREVAGDQTDAAISRPIWAGEKLPTAAASVHFMAVGMSGSGKSTLIGMLMNSVLPPIGQGLGCRALVYDDKQEYLALLQGMVDPARVVIMNPLDQRCHAWDIAADVTDPTVALQVAAVFVPPEPYSHQPFFSDSARRLMAEVMSVFMVKAKGAWTFRDLVLACSTHDNLKRVLYATPAGKAVFNTFFNARESGGDIMTTLLTKIAYLPPLAAGWEHAAKARPRVSLGKWLAGEGVLLLSGDSTVRESLSAVNQILFNRCAQLLLGRPEPVTDRTWVFLDEVREGPKFAEVPSLLNQGRSKKISVVLGFQSLEGLEQHYPGKLAHEIASDCGIRAFLKVESQITSEWASGEIGRSEFWVNERSVGGGGVSVSERRQEKALVLPTELRALPRPEDSGRLAGWYVTPYTGPFYRELSRQQVAALAPKPAVDDQGKPVPNAMRRPPEELALDPWNDADLKRLGLQSQGPAPGSGGTGEAQRGKGINRRRLYDTDQQSPQP